MSYYTVLLLRPDYIADPYGQDTYLAHVVANGAEDAIVVAQRGAWDADGIDDDCAGADDYRPLLVCIGHVEDLKP